MLCIDVLSSRCCNTWCNLITHVSIHLRPFSISSVSELKYEEVTVEEMWKVIEDFGVSRIMLERTNPSNKIIENIYLAIKSEK